MAPPAINYGRFGPNNNNGAAAAAAPPMPNFNVWTPPPVVANPTPPVNQDPAVGEDIIQEPGPFG